MSHSKREPESSMILEVEGKEIEIDVYLDPGMLGIRFELTAKAEIEPMDAAFCLLLIIRNYCDAAGTSIDSLLNAINKEVPDDSVKH